MKAGQDLKVNALQFKQGEFEVYAFALPGKALRDVADISRVTRDEQKRLVGFQRPEIQQHVRQITSYLDEGPGLFPNAIILALSPEVSFKQSRGPQQAGAVQGVRAGYLSLPVLAEGRRVAWIVDGQQRSLALAQATRRDLLVPVIAFASASLQTRREQFILVNRAKPLAQRFVNELLPETEDTNLPDALSINRMPSRLCDELNTDSASPFFGRIQRPSTKSKQPDAITDSPVLEMIRARVNPPAAALAHLRGLGARPPDAQAIYRILRAYWNAVSKAFPEAWAKGPRASRLTHAVGIFAMGSLLDRIANRVDLNAADLEAMFLREIQRIAPQCAWTSGTWPVANLPWHAFEATSASRKKLSGLLHALYIEQARP